MSFQLEKTLIGIPLKDLQAQEVKIAARVVIFLALTFTVGIPADVTRTVLFSESSRLVPAPTPAPEESLSEDVSPDTNPHSVVVEARHPVAVLGVDSIDGDDELARTIASMLEKGLPLAEGLREPQSRSSIALMELAYDCSRRRMSCLSQMAESLNVSMIVYGEMRRLGVVGEHGFYEIVLLQYSYELNDIVQVLQTTLPFSPTMEELEDLRQQVQEL